MHQDSWLRPSLADGWSAWASDAAPASQPEPRSRVALDSGSNAPGLAQGVARIGRAIPLGDAGRDMWGDAARMSATASALRSAHAPAHAPAPAPASPVVGSAPPTPTRVAKPASDRPHSAGPRARPRMFEFIGHGALSVTSSITGKHYRFTEHGAQLAVDPRDWSQLSRVPSLRAVVL